jgi:hypothetical protein
MPDTPKKPLSKDMTEAMLFAMLDNPDQAEAIAALSDEDLARIEESVPEDDEEPPVGA